MIHADAVDIITVMVGAAVFGGLLATGAWLASEATPRRASVMWWVQKPPKPVSHVYVLRDTSMPWSPVKVGLSVDPERRAESISRETGKPLQVHYAARVPDAYAVEQAAHRLLRRQRLCRVYGSSIEC